MIDSNKDYSPTGFSPKGVNKDGSLQTPSAFRINSIECINQYNTIYDIVPLVKRFTITEELFSPVLVLNMRIRDNANFFEDFKLNGQEKIKINVYREINGKEEELKLQFAVKEYPDYVKSASEPDVQEYSIIGISEFGYSSMLTKISRSIKGNPIDNIKKIFEDDLNTKVKIKSACSSMFDGIITISSPLKAIEWLRSKSFDWKGSPFFAYSNITSDKEVHIASLSTLWSSDASVGTFKYRRMVQNGFTNKDFYAENATRILDMKSNIKLDKLDQAIRGAFASKTTSTDIASKTITEEVFDIKNNEFLKTQKRLNPNHDAFSDIQLVSFGKDIKTPLNQLSKASLTNVSTNSSAISDGNQNSSSTLSASAAKAKSFYSNFENVNHQIQLYGDFKLNVGKKINIEVTKSHTIKKPKKMAESDQLDTAMSGTYIIAVAAHTFAEGMYMTKLKIIKDTI